MITKLYNALVVLFFIALPVNLGIHFTLPSSYVSGILIDYLQPALYMQDILTGFILLIYLAGAVSKTFSTPVLTKGSALYILFLIAVLLASVVSQDKFLSMLYFGRILGYTLVSWVLVNAPAPFKVKRLVGTVLFVQLVLLGVLGILQFLKQGAVFTNYLFFGEQPYTFYTKGITREVFFDSGFVPPYGLFRHPNAFGAYLCLLLTLFFAKAKKRWVLLLPIVALCLTYSFSAVIAFCFGTFALYKRTPLIAVKALTISVFIFGLIFFFLPVSPQIRDNASYYRRTDLLTDAYKHTGRHPLFGVGPGVSLLDFRSRVFLSRDLSFIQPVHNVFVLLAQESGLIAAGVFILYIIYILRNSAPLKTLLILQIVMLGSFDHYFLTMHQPMLLMFLILHGALDSWIE